jgi:hypothetical protein
MKWYLNDIDIQKRRGILKGWKMPAKNIYHDAVVEALKADGWTITADPLTVTYGLRRLFVDLAAERTVIAAERKDERIAVEVQSFLGDSDIENLQHAVGQYVVYRLLLDEIEESRHLYLAVPDDVYTGILSEPLGQLVLADLKMRLLVFNPSTRGITQWIS